MLKLASWGFRKCGTFGVYDFLKGSYWLSKSSQISRKKMGRRRCQKKKNCHNFDFSGLKRIAKVAHRVDYTCYSFQTRKLKIVAVLFFDTSYFWGRTENFKVCWLWVAITPVKKLARPKSTTFSETSGPELSHGPILEKFSHQKISRRRVFSKKRRFLLFFVSTPKKNFQVAANRTILILEGLPMAHLKAYVPNFQKSMWKRS